MKPAAPTPSLRTPSLHAPGADKYVPSVDIAPLRVGLRLRFVAQNKMRSQPTQMRTLRPVKLSLRILGLQ